MNESFWLVIAGGLVGLISSLVPLYLKRRWEREDRRRDSDRKALESAVRKLMAWQDLAVRQLGSGNTEPAEQRLRDLDVEWESDFDLIPDREGVREFLHYRSRSSAPLQSTGS